MHGSYQTLEVIPDTNGGTPYPNGSTGVFSYPGMAPVREWIPLTNVEKVVEVNDGRMFALVGHHPYTSEWREVAPGAMVTEPRFDADGSVEE